jgi:hypothetical protein
LDHWGLQIIASQLFIAAHISLTYLVPTSRLLSERILVQEIYFSIAGNTPDFIPGPLLIFMFA